MTSTLNATIARAIRAERSRLGMSQEALATALGWSRQTLTKIENVQRPLYAHEQAEMCEALGVGLLQLLDRASARDKAALRI